MQSWMRTPSQRARLAPVQLVWLSLTLALATACVDPAEPVGSSGAGTGSVNILFTDAPSDEFDAVNITTTKMELLGGPDGPVAIFEGHETFDLLALRNVNELFSVADGIRSGHYERIRMSVDRLQLVFPDGSDEDADIPAYVDLLPMGGIDVRGGEALALQIDIDVDKSVHFRAGWRFRPVIFVKILHNVLDGRLTRLHGSVRNIDVDAGSFELCHMRRPLAWVHDKLRNRWAHDEMPRPSSRLMVDNDNDGESDEDQRHHPLYRCVKVELTDSASIFDENADPIRLGGVEAGERATVIGRVHPVSDRLQLIAELMLLGVRGNYEVKMGRVASEYDEALQQFVLELRSGNGELIIQLQNGTRLYERDGSPLTPDSIEPDLPTAAFGVLFFSSEDPAYLKTVVVILDLEAEEPEPLRGEIVSDGCVSSAGDTRLPGICQMKIETDDDAIVPVCVFERTFILLIEGEQSNEIDASELMMGDSVDVYGRPIADTCFGAGVIVAFPGEDEPEPGPEPLPAEPDPGTGEGAV
jgi:hypothetical protein